MHPALDLADRLASDCGSARKTYRNERAPAADRALLHRVEPFHAPGHPARRRAADARRCDRYPIGGCVRGLRASDERRLARGVARRTSDHGRVRLRAWRHHGRSAASGPIASRRHRALRGRDAGRRGARPCSYDAPVARRAHRRGCEPRSRIFRRRLTGMRIDLNCDMGESFGAWRMGDDETLLDIVTSANIACGFHAGDPTVMEATVKAALRRGVAIGAHPSYPDLAGFGRRSMRIAPDELERIVLYQIAALAGMAEANGGKLAHVKPHGALYNDAAKDRALADAIASAIKRHDATLTLVGLADSALIEAGRAAGLPTAAGGFWDRADEADGSLRAREKAGAVFTDPVQAAEQALKLAQSGRIQTLCIHGDTPGAAGIARAVRAALEKSGAAIKALGRGP